MPVTTSPPCSRTIDSRASVDRLRAALGHRPAHQVGRHPQHQAVGGGDRLLQVQDGVGRQPRQEGPALDGLQPAPDQAVGRPDAHQPVPGEGERVAGREGERRQQAVDQVEAGGHERPHQLAVGVGVGTRGRGGLVHRPVQQGRRDRRPGGWPPGPRGGATRPRGPPGAIERMAFEARPRAQTVEQVSWRNPGRVSSAVRAPPPSVSCASSTRTLAPWAPRVAAATSPLGPEPDDDGVVLAIGHRVRVPGPRRQPARRRPPRPVPPRARRASGP